MARRCPANTQPYTIQQGDTYFKIARRYNTTVIALRRTNPDVDPRNLKVGQQICIPSLRH
ncbi:MAG: LysM peptidoglycan-binding domain-containing protein [Halothermotrichaceae bacterium]